MIPSQEQRKQIMVSNAEAISEHGVNFIPCCHQQKMVKTYKVKTNEDRYVCLYCGIVLTESTTEESPIIICGERELIDLRRANGLEELAERMESFLRRCPTVEGTICTLDGGISNTEIVIDKIPNKPKIKL